MKSCPTDFRIGTAGVGASAGFSASTWAVACKAWNTFEISAGRSFAATVLLPAKEATISVVKVSSSCRWLSLPIVSSFLIMQQTHEDVL